MERAKALRSTEQITELAKKPHSSRDISIILYERNIFEWDAKQQKKQTMMVYYLVDGELHVRVPSPDSIGFNC